MSTIDDYILIKDFPISNIFREHEKNLINKFKKDKIDRTGLNSSGYNTPYGDLEFDYIIGNKFSNIVNTTFHVGMARKPIITWVYAQNNKHSSENWHSHINSSTINAVSYLNPPKNGGGLQVKLFDEVKIIQPEENKLYLMPYWLEHSPQPQEDEEWRICIVLEYFCFERPRMKNKAIIW